MQPDDLFICVPPLGDAIDRNPLIVTPETSLLDAIALMSQARGSNCTLPNPNSSASDSFIEQTVRSSCVLVMEGNQLRGIFTERDIVWLTADGLNFEGVKIASVMSHPVITLPEADFQDVFGAVFLFRRYRIRHLVIVDEHDQLVGIVSPESIRRVMHPANLLKLRRVAEVMTTEAIHAPRTASVLSLARLMAEQRISCVVITEENEEGGFQPLGIVTERDIVQFQTLQLNLSRTQAQTVMSTPLLLLSPEDSLGKAHHEMQRLRVRRLVVSWNRGKGLGIITQTSLLRVFDPMELYGVIEVLQRTVKQLEAEKAELLRQCKLEPQMPSPSAQWQAE
ncbi:MAG TPA: CBS domain-containing protein [Coleofasciculaceae cyanobacterium]